MSSESSDLVKGERGAIMLTGLFMACFLIGALWFVIGIGDTIVFRDKMQEAADQGAFSSAALHAKGMNFISLCNLVMLVGTVIHIILGVISDVKFALAIVACITVVGCPSAIADFEAAYRNWDNYFRSMRQAFKAIHNVQKVSSYAYPALGVVEAYQNGTKYGGDSRTGPVRVLAVSSSIMPGAAARQLGQASNKKEGLPVEAKKFEDLCKKVVAVSSTMGISLINSGKAASGSSIGGRALSIFNSIVGTVLQARYCNKTDLHFEPFGPGFDSFWGEDGPYVVYQPAANGNIWMQSWAINVTPKLKDTSESRVGLAAKKFAKYTKEEGSFGYFAQAELYFDCDSTWTASTCNYEDSATYAIKWRARLRRLEMAQIASGAVGAALASFSNLEAINNFRDAIPQKIGDLLGASGIGRTALKGLIDGVIAQLEMAGRAVVLDKTGKFDPTLSGVNVTPYH